MDALRIAPRGIDGRRRQHCRRLSCTAFLPPSRTRGMRRQLRVTVHAYRWVAH